MIGLCVDSGSQLPPDLAARHRIEVVPLTVMIDGVEYLEGVDIDADGFYARFEGGGTPEVSTAAPGPGRFAAAYGRLAAAGATEVVSIHTGSEVSGTFNAARLAAGTAPVPVHIVDSHSASFAVACAALAAAEAVDGGAGASDAAAAATDAAGRCGNVFVVGTLALARAGGRLDPAVGQLEGLPILRLDGGTMSRIGDARSADEAASAMAVEILTAGPRLRVGVGTADPSSVPVGEALRRLLEEAPADVEVIPYRVGPSVGAHTGPGTAGAVYHARI